MFYIRSMAFWYPSFIFFSCALFWADACPRSVYLWGFVGFCFNLYLLCILLFSLHFLNKIIFNHKSALNLNLTHLCSYRDCREILLQSSQQRYRNRIFFPFTFYNGRLTVLSCKYRDNVSKGSFTPGIIVYLMRALVCVMSVTVHCSSVFF